MDIPFYISSFILAALMLVGIAESDRFLKMVKPKSKKVYVRLLGYLHRRAGGSRSGLGRSQAAHQQTKNYRRLGHLCSGSRRQDERQLG
jgi:hypothetical protein